MRGVSSPASGSVGRRNILAMLVDRSNYGRMRPLLLHLQDRDDVELEVAATGSMVLERFGRPVEMLRADGLQVVAELYCEVEGTCPVSMAKSIALSTSEFATLFNARKPDVALIIGDRHETLGAAIAAAYMNITLVHIQGGEVSGSIDESARHAISKLAHYHCPATARSAEFLLRMGEHQNTILSVGCPSSDMALTLKGSIDPQLINGQGSGAEIDLDQPYLMATFHPTTTEFGSEQQDVVAFLEALKRIDMQTVLLWPNIDAGSHRIGKEIRRFRKTTTGWLRTLLYVPPLGFLQLLRGAACAVGNSSGFVRDGGYFGTPVVLVGHRQHQRERGPHVKPVEADTEEIEAAIREQLAHGPYAPITLYGDGQVCERIADGIVSLTPYSQKSLSYLDETSNVRVGAYK